MIDRDGDVFGRTVILAARIATRAGPGEVLVDGGVVRSWTGAGVAFEPIAEVSLKGVPDPTPLWNATIAPG